jgi:plasmid stability protein
MATLTVRNLDDAVVRRLRIRAAEHREILKMVLTDAEPSPTRQQAAERLAEFRRRTAGRGTSSIAELLAETRTGRLRSLTGTEP